MRLALILSIPQGKEEQEVDVMLKVSKLPLPELLAVRSSLKELRDVLNQRSFELLEGLIMRVCTGKEND